MSNNKKNALQDYVEVNVRIEKFYEKFPNGRILTDLISWENGVVVMKATVYRDSESDKPSATGHAYEKEGSSFINKTSALENCETSAVGRALAILGFEIKKSVASKEEVENAKLNQNDQEEQKPISSKQVGLLKKLAKELAMMKQVNEDEIYEKELKMKMEDVQKISSQGASGRIAHLNKLIMKEKQGEAS